MKDTLALLGICAGDHVLRLATETGISPTEAENLLHRLVTYENARQVMNVARALNRDPYEIARLCKPRSELLREAA